MTICCKLRIHEGYLSSSRGYVSKWLSELVWPILLYYSAIPLSQMNLIVMEPCHSKLVRSYLIVFS